MALVAIGVDILTAGRYRAIVVAGALLAAGLLYMLAGSGVGAATTTLSHGLEGPRALTRLVDRFGPNGVAGQ